MLGKCVHEWGHACITYMPHNAIYGHTGTKKSKSYGNHAPRGWGKMKFQQVYHIWTGREGASEGMPYIGASHNTPYDTWAEKGKGFKKHISVEMGKSACKSKGSQLAMCDWERAAFRSGTCAKRLVTWWCEYDRVIVYRLHSKCRGRQDMRTPHVANDLSHDPGVITPINVYSDRLRRTARINTPCNRISSMSSSTGTGGIFFLA